MRRIVFGLCIVIVAVLGWIGYVEWKAAAITRVPFTVQKTDGDFQIRRYPSMVLASVDATGTRQTGFDAAIPQLRAFIGGDNRSEDVIDTTRPILLEPVDEDATEDSPPAEEDDWSEDDWIVSFVMPNWFTAGTLPRPNSDAVEIRSQSAATVAVVTFSGFVGDEDLTEETAQLLDYMAQNDLTAAGPPRYAIYDPPWRLPFLRHNEVIIPLAEPRPAQ